MPQQTGVVQKYSFKALKMFNGHEIMQDIKLFKKNNYNEPFHEYQIINDISNLEMDGCWD